MSSPENLQPDQARPTPILAEPSTFGWHWLVWAVLLVFGVFAAVRVDGGRWLLPVLLVGLCLPTFLRWRRLPWLLLISAIPVLLLLGGAIPIVLSVVLMVGLFTTIIYGVGAAMVPRRAFLRFSAGVLMVLGFWWFMFTALDTVPSHRKSTPDWNAISKQFDELEKHQPKSEEGISPEQD